MYSDGDQIEDNILKAYKASEREKQIAKLLDTNQWPFVYHLSTQRQNILSWFPFKKNSSILEIGAGCGAITELLISKANKVTAVELSSRRAEIIKARLKGTKNLEVISQNMHDIPETQKYDYVIAIGVLEYSGKYIEGDDPYAAFLSKLKPLLKSTGTAIIAIENKYGIKYWSGAPEDHTNRHFDSIEGYPNDQGIKTFSKSEITELFKKVGFNKLDFYYPMPDYKFPIDIFSDHSLPNTDNLRFRDYFEYDGQGRDRIFDEAYAMRELVKNKQFDFFANSFLITAQI